MFETRRVEFVKCKITPQFSLSTRFIVLNQLHDVTSADNWVRAQNTNGILQVTVISWSSFQPDREIVK